MPKLLFLVLLFTFMNPFTIFSQTKEAGPVILEYGKVWKVENPEFGIDTDKEYKVVFDVMDSPESHTEINKSIETAARFLNMHVQSGVPLENLKVVLVVHNKASKDLITHKAYQERFNTNNPNAELIEALLDAGTEVVFCGQSSLSRNFPKKELIDGVQMALSAMTALIDLQDRGYRLIKF